MLAKQWKQDLLWLAALVLVSLGARFWLIDRLASPLPFWDAWEQARYVFAPYFAGKLTLASLFRSHNENRIVFARLYDLALLLWNGQWDGQVQMVCNCVLYVGGLALFAWVLVRCMGRQFWPVISLALTLVLVLPFAWENTLAGFHAQVYFMLLTSLFTIWLLGFHKPLSGLWFCGVASAFAAPFTLLGGIFGPAAVCGLCVFRLLVGGVSRSALLKSVPTILVCLIVIGIGLATRVEVPYHQILKPHSGTQFLMYLGRYLSWPWIVLPPFAVINWLPSVLLAWTYWKRQATRTTATELVLALGLWAFLHALTTSLARGGQAYPQWRYMDSACWVMLSNLLALSLLVTAYREFLPRFWSSLLTWRPKIPLIAFSPIPWLWAAAAASGMVLLSGRAWLVDIPERENDLAHQLVTLRAYLATGDRATLQVPRKEYLTRFAAPDEPQDHPQALIDMLGKTGVRSHLPACARDPLRIVPETNSGVSSNSFLAVDSAPFQAFTNEMLAIANSHSFNANVSALLGPSGTVPGEAVWSSENSNESKSHFESKPLHSTLPYLEFRLRGVPSRQLSLSLVEEISGQSRAIPLEGLSSQAWKTVRVQAPRKDFKIVFADEGAGWLAFQEPRELGTISLLTYRLLNAGFVFLALGAVFFVAAFSYSRERPRLAR